MIDSNDRSPKPLGSRPEASGFSVERLLAKTASGNVRIPDFQRPLRWRARHVIDFFDSIRRGFPVGNLLLSRAPAPASIVQFGSIQFDATEQQSALWVVDGQQRIVALAATLLRRETIPRGDYWSIWYDLENEAFRQLIRKEPVAGWIPLNVLANSVELSKWIHRWPLSQEREDLVDRAFELGKAVREYQIPAYIVEDSGQDELRLIFTRVNTGGVDMRESEIFEALYCHDEKRPIQSATSRLCDLNFGLLDTDLFLRCLRATCGTSVRAENQRPAEFPKGAVERTESAIRRSVDTIKLTAGIPHWKLLPYRLPLIVLAAFYDRFPADDARIDRLVARWIWRGALTGDHDNVSDGRVDRIVKLVREASSASQAIGSLLAQNEVPDSPQELPNHPINELDAPLSLGRAASKIFILALLAAELNNNVHPHAPTLWEFDTNSPDPLEDSLDTALTPQDTRRFYWSLTDRENVGTDTIVKLPGMKRRDLFSANAATLRSFLLDPTSISHLKNNQIEKFRDHRRPILHEWFCQFTIDRLGDKVDLRPGIQSILNARSQ